MKPDPSCSSGTSPPGISVSAQTLDAVVAWLYPWKESAPAPAQPGTGYRGVFRSWVWPHKPWRAQIRLGSEVKNLGLHASAEEAARAYDRASRSYYGNRARLNFPGRS